MVSHPTPRGHHHSRSRVSLFLRLGDKPRSTGPIPAKAIRREVAVIILRTPLTLSRYHFWMMTVRDALLRVDALVIKLMDAVGLPFPRVGIGVIFIWFGALKPMGISPAEDLLAATVYWWTPEIVVPAIGYWEVLIGVTFLIPALTRVAIFLLAFQMPGTFLPLVLLPEVCWDDFPLGLTLEGQYIVKNLIIIGAALVIGSRVSGLRATKREALNTTRSLTVPIP